MNVGLFIYLSIVDYARFPGRHSPPITINKESGPSTVARTVAGGHRGISISCHSTDINILPVGVAGQLVPVRQRL